MGDADAVVAIGRLSIEDEAPGALTDGQGLRLQEETLTVGRRMTCAKGGAKLKGRTLCGIFRCHRAGTNCTDRGAETRPDG